MWIYLLSNAPDSDDDNCGGVGEKGAVGGELGVVLKTCNARQSNSIEPQWNSSILQ